MTLFSMLYMLLISLLLAASNLYAEEQQNIVDEDLKELRLIGYCQNQCDIGNDLLKDGYFELLKLYEAHKANYDFMKLCLGHFNEDETSEDNEEGVNDTNEEISQEDDGNQAENDTPTPPLEDYGNEESSENEANDDGVKNLPFPDFDNFQYFCNSVPLDFESCFAFYQLQLNQKSQVICLNTCYEFKKLATAETTTPPEATPTFDQMSLMAQDFETCVTGFQGPLENFQAHQDGSISQARSPENRGSVDMKLDEMVETLKKNGFVVIENFFDPIFMQEILSTIKLWREEKVYKSLNYSDFAATEHLHTYTDRSELILPFVAPFTTLLEQVKQSKVFHPLFERYSAWKMTSDPTKYEFDNASSSNILIELLTSTMNFPGAKEQNIHPDYTIPQSMINLNIAMHDMVRKDGPTAFCPCTHKFARTIPFYEMPCTLHYHPAVVKSGTVTIYDLTLWHHGMPNDGEKERSILNLMWSNAEVSPEVSFDYPREYFGDKAKEHFDLYQSHFNS